MFLKKISYTLLVCLISSPCALAEDIKKIKASLNEVTVFFNGAELIHTASPSLAKGTNQVLITDLSPGIDVSTLKIKANKGVIVSSFEYSHDFVSRREASGNEKTLKDSIEFYEKNIEEFDISIKTNDDLLELLKANKTISGSQNGLNVNELIKMVDYYSSKSNELHKAQSTLKERKTKNIESLTRVKRQLEQESMKNTKYMGVLKLFLTSPLTTTSDFTISYYTQNSGWTPYYNINVPNTQKQIEIASKAQVRQTTGLDWNRVKLTLSTATPSSNKTAPLFNAWFLNYTTTPSYTSTKVLSQNRHSYTEPRMVEDMKEKISFDITASVNSEQQSPLYILDGMQISEQEYREISPDLIQNISTLANGASSTTYGSQATNGVVMITTKKMENFVTRDEKDLNMVYNIDLPYTIEGNGKIQSIDLQTHIVSADFKYYSVPKLDLETFLLAEISDWQKLGLLTGKANITFDGTYVGESIINASSISSRLTLTLGTDKRVSVKREKMQDMSSRKFLGKDTKQEFAYKITVRNNQNQTIKMTLKDQYPLTSQKEIEVELLEEFTTPPTYNNKGVGVLSWEFDLPAGETKEFQIMYNVKYPKDKPINL